MSDKRQKNQLVLAFTEEGRSEAPKASQEGTESRTAKCETERPASHEQLMEEVCERENCWQAYKRVKANKGSPGIDGMTVGELSGYLVQHWPTIREQLLRGTYQPQPVKRVEIPKPEGRSLRTALDHSSHLGWAEIRHPFHPLRGQRFEVLKKRRILGVDTLILRELERGSFSVAREWTDWADPSWYDALGFSPHRLDANSLFELVTLLKKLAGSQSDNKKN